MLNGAAPEPQPQQLQPQQLQPQQAFKAEDIHRQQRVNLMARVLDLECENALLQQEVQQLKNHLLQTRSPTVVSENPALVE